MHAATRNMRLPIVVVMAKPSREVSMPETSLRRRPGTGQGGTGKAEAQGPAAASPAIRYCPANSTKSKDATVTRYPGLSGT